MTPPAPRTGTELPKHGPRTALLVGTAVLFAARWYGAHSFGFGDAEALYAAYARHPQAVYVDHPGLIGVMARAIGGGDIPSPRAAHLVTTVLATLAPALVALVARMLAASWQGAAIAALLVMVTPMTAIGLYALTPDLPLFLTWYLAVGCGGCALASAPGSLRALSWALAAGLATGLACDAKLSGALLLAGLAASFASHHARPHLRTLAPYAALAIAAVVASPVIRDEVARGYPMLRHRLLDPHAAWGPSVRNLGALVGGQLLYLSPAMCLGALWTLRDLHAARHRDAVSMLLWRVTAASVPLVLLCLLSRVAEPHWMAPLYLALPLHWARNAEALLGRMGRRFAWTASIVAGAFTAATLLWVFVPLACWLTPASARYDLANDLIAWPKALPVVRQALQESARDDVPAIVVAPHWTLCAQLASGLPRTVWVGCNSPAGDDWDEWLPRRTWQRAPVLLYVTDSRGFGRDDARPQAEDEPEAWLAQRRTDASWSARILRGGVEVRTVRVLRLVTDDVAVLRE